VEDDVANTVKSGVDHAADAVKTAKHGVADAGESARGTLASAVEAVAPPFRIEARLHTLVDRQRRQHVQPNGGWPNSQDNQRAQWPSNQDDQRARDEQRRAYEQQYQDRLRQQQEEARRRAACNPRPPPPPAPQPRRNCQSRRTQELRLPPTPPPVPIRRNCRPRPSPTYPPPPVHQRVNCRPTSPPPPPPPQPQRRPNCIPRTPTYPPPQQQYYNCLPAPTYPSQPQPVPCYPSPAPQQPIRYTGCIPQRLPRGDEPGRGNEFRASDGCISPVINLPDDCEGSVKIVSVDAAGKVVHYMYKTAKDANQVLEQVGGKVADSTQNLAEGALGAIEDLANLGLVDMAMR
ncbi:hypothetical protein COOONC_27306, partial [Cooperia oncophora]